MCIIVSMMAWCFHGECYVISTVDAFIYTTMIATSCKIPIKSINIIFVSFPICVMTYACPSILITYEL